MRSETKFAGSSNDLPNIISHDVYSLIMHARHMTVTYSADLLCPLVELFQLLKIRFKPVLRPKSFLPLVPEL
jgi:hypothetical protein